MKDFFKHLIHKIEIIDSVIGLVGILFILGAALFIQVFLKEEPCPLCLLQRAAFVNIGLALILNIRYRNKASHWGLAIFSACAGIAVSLRQITLHINNPIGFGSTILGLHMYTWCFIAFSAVIVGCSLMLLIYPENSKISG